MGIPLTQKQLDDMDSAFLERTPRIPVTEDPTKCPYVVSIAGGANPMGLLLNVRLSDGAIRTVVLNPVVTQGLVRLIPTANDKHGWWRDNGDPYKMPFSEQERAAMHASFLDQVPPTPGISEYESAPHVISLFGCGWPIGMMLNLRVANGDIIGWMLNPIVLGHLLIVASKSARMLGWWDKEGSYILDRPHA